MFAHRWLVLVFFYYMELLDHIIYHAWLHLSMFSLVRRGRENLLNIAFFAFA